MNLALLVVIHSCIQSVIHSFIQSINLICSKLQARGCVIWYMFNIFCTHSASCIYFSPENVHLIMWTHITPPNTDHTCQWVGVGVYFFGGGHIQPCSGSFNISSAATISLAGGKHHHLTFRAILPYHLSLLSSDWIALVLCAVSNDNSTSI